MSRSLGAGGGPDKRGRRLLAATAVFIGFAVFAGIGLRQLLPAEPLGPAIPCSRLLRAADGTVLRLTLAGDGQYRLWTSLDEIAPAAVEAILLKEDRFFHLHPGVNLQALLRAAWTTYVRGERQGGSTLSMQLARRLHRLNTRTLSGKLKQILLALWLEARHSKRELLEAYCNLAPMGGNIEGLGAAARIYFAKTASQLTVAESLALAVMPQNPTKRSDFGAEQQQARRRLAQAWRVRHPEQSPETILADQEIKGLRRGHLPYLAPHLTDHLLVRETGRRQVIDTTLDSSLQGLLERLMRQYLTERRHLGMANAAALLVDRRDMGVRALVGSADYFDPVLHGQVNGVLAKRSPGSTLKPFLYGLALDQGLIHPLSMLSDAPTAFGPFQPENFDGRFVGPISATEALIRSRNVPAIWLANRVQRPSLHDLLRTAGVARLRSEAHYGLALALGGGELTMEELAELYAMLANGGLLKPLRYRQDDPQLPGTRLLSPQAAFLVRDMLRRNPRPDRRDNGLWPTAWKTGTSWGFRDAWTVGLTVDYVLAVWIGNFDGQPNPAFVGIQAAAPLFFRLVDALALTRRLQPPQADQPPPGLTRIEVCAASGDLPNRWCPQTAVTWFIPGKSPIRVSTLHRPVMIDSRTGQAACPPFDPAVTRLEVFAFWPSDLQRLFRDAGLARRQPPEPAAGCDQPPAMGNQGDPPRLNSPLTGVTYTLRLSKPEETIELSAAIDGDAQRMYWFADTRYLGSSRRDGFLPWRPAASGRYEVSVVDDQGRGASRTLEVAFVP